MPQMEIVTVACLLLLVFQILNMNEGHCIIINPITQVSVEKPKVFHQGFFKQYVS